MITINELISNSNTKLYNIQEEDLRRERIGYCNYILDAFTGINGNGVNGTTIQPEIASIAMFYCHKFYFAKNSFINYDKRILACSAVLLACKSENIQGKMTDLSRYYVHREKKLLKKTNEMTIKPEDFAEATEKIANSEIQLLKSLNFKTECEFPSDYIYIYSNLLYSDIDDQILEMAFRHENDSFYTLANNLFPPYTVALACIVIAAEFLGLVKVTDDKFNNFQQMENFMSSIICEMFGDELEISNEEIEARIDLNSFNQKLLKYKTQTDSLLTSGRIWFSQLPWYRKLHPFLVENDLYCAVELIMQLYEDVSKQ